MQRDTPWRTLLIAELLVAAAVAGFHWGLAPQLTATYEQAGLTLPAPTRIVLSSPALIAIAGLGVLASILAALFTTHRGRRLRVLAISVTVTGLAFVAAFIAAVWPFSQG